ncbi:tyrosine-type recombinase/integrase [Streptomyces cacaoi]|uniref:tyrosine-type recombinase/integrase n=1 Tax=Streptomyces cacaoi TaxID=1898 RepID=UPI002606B72F|nr:site-specific integrase [Streptomyces cacaoi]
MNVGKTRSSAQAGYSLDVRLWKVTRTGRTARPYRLRWVVGGRVHSATFATSALADSRRSELRQAMRRGEAFHVASGLPESEVRAAADEEAREESPLLWLDFCRSYVAGRWRGSAAKTRESMADSLATATLAMVDRGDGAPSAKELRLALRWAVVPANRGQEPPPSLGRAVEWLDTAARPVADIEKLEVLRDVGHQLRFRMDGSPAAGDTLRRRRRALNAALEEAVTEGILSENPLPRLRRAQQTASDVVDPRVLVNPVQGRQLLAAVSYVGSWNRMRGRRLVAFFGVMLYAALRPAEAVGLRLRDCDLPSPEEPGAWGMLTLRETRPVSGKQWTDTGDRHDKRGLKAREATDDRPVPIPPVLVAMLRRHLEQFGTAKGSRIFGNERGDVVGTSTYWRVWEEARLFALPPDRVDSPLAGRPYDLRHTCITRWLNAGVPIAEVARRVGNSPEVIHRRYHGCIDGHEEVANMKIAKALEEEGDAA